MDPLTPQGQKPHPPQPAAEAANPDGKNPWNPTGPVAERGGDTLERTGGNLAELLDKLADIIKDSLGLGFFKKLIAGAVINNVKSKIISAAMDQIHKSLQDAGL